MPERRDFGGGEFAKDYPRIYLKSLKNSDFLVWYWLAATVLSGDKFCESNPNYDSVRVEKRFNRLTQSKIFWDATE